MKCISLLAVLALMFGSAAPADAAKKKKKAAKPATNAEAVFERLDTNKDGKLSHHEFAAFHHKAKGKSSAGSAKAHAKANAALFKKLDTNHDKHLSYEEFKKVFAKAKTAPKAKKPAKKKV